MRRENQTLICFEFDSFSFSSSSCSSCSSLSIRSVSCNYNIINTAARDAASETMKAIYIVLRVKSYTENEKERESL